MDQAIPQKLSDSTNISINTFWLMAALWDLLRIIINHSIFSFQLFLFTDIEDIEFFISTMSDVGFLRNLNFFDLIKFENYSTKR